MYFPCYVHLVIDMVVIWSPSLPLSYLGGSVMNRNTFGVSQLQFSGTLWILGFRDKPAESQRRKCPTVSRARDWGTGSGTLRWSEHWVVSEIPVGACVLPLPHPTLSESWACLFYLPVHSALFLVAAAGCLPFQDAQVSPVNSWHRQSLSLLTSDMQHFSAFLSGPQ